MAAARKLALQCVGSSGDLHVTSLDVCLCALHSCVQRVQGGSTLECLLLLGKVLTVPKESGILLGVDSKCVL